MIQNIGRHISVLSSWKDTVICANDNNHIWGAYGFKLVLWLPLISFNLFLYICWFLFIRFIYFYCKGRLTGETKRNIFHLPVHSQVAKMAGDELIQVQEPGVRKFFQAFHVGAGSQGFEPSSTGFPGHKHDPGREVEQRGHELVRIGILAHARWGI